MASKGWIVVLKVVLFMAGVAVAVKLFLSKVSNSSARALGAEIIKEKEGLYLKAYQDSVGIWTIGYGTIKYSNGKKVQPGETITSINAEKEMLYELDNDIIPVVDKAVKVKISDRQRGVLYSFAYNEGAPALAGSTFMKKLNAGASSADLQAEFMRWVYAGGKYIQGLYNRREFEWKVWIS